MRASRLVALLLHLRHRGGCTAAALADELGVSVRTIYRDVADLQAAGVPLWTDAGPGGGIRLLDGWSGEIDGLTADEAGALVLSGAPSAALELGLGSVVAAAQAKVMATLPPELRGRAARVRERFLLDAPGWFHAESRPEHLAIVAEAVWAEERLDIRYRRDTREVSRRIDPLGLVMKAGTWYLVAAHRGRPRTYRVSRIRAASPVGQRVERPASFELERWWGESTDDFDRSLLRTSVRVRVDAPGARSLPHHLGRAAAERALASAEPPDGAGWRTIELPVESVEVAASQLVALGDHVEVLEPPSLRRAMAELGRAIAARHEEIR